MPQARRPNAREERTHVRAVQPLELVGHHLRLSGPDACVIYTAPPPPPPSMIGVVTRAGNGAGWVQSKQALARGVPIAHIIEALWVSTPATVTGRWRARRLNNVCCWSAACRATTPDCWWADGLTGQGSTHGGLSSPGAAARASRPATTYPPAPPPGRRPWPGVFTLNISGQEQG
jgi:hypothetical protein